MDNRHLQSLLTDLYAELNARKGTDSPDREVLERLAADVETALHSRSADAARYHGLRDKLSEAAGALEAAHPGLVTAAENVIEALVRYNL